MYQLGTTCICRNQQVRLKLGPVGRQSSMFKLVLINIENHSSFTRIIELGQILAIFNYLAQCEAKKKMENERQINKYYQCGTLYFCQQLFFCKLEATCLEASIVTICKKKLIRTYLNHSTMNIRRLFLSPAEAKKHKRQIVNRGKWLIKPKVWKFLQKCGSLKRSTRFSSCV